MNNNKKKFVNIILINILILFILTIVIESIFGYWFKKNNFGYHMRSERNKIVKFTVNHHDNKEISFSHKRNFYGFIGEEFEPANGSSTTSPASNSIIFIKSFANSIGV